jgi:MFS family permease
MSRERRVFSSYLQNANATRRRTRRCLSTNSSSRISKWLNNIGADDSDTLDSKRLYRYLGLYTFKTDEIQEKFRLIERAHEGDKSVPGITAAHIEKFLAERIEEIEDEKAPPSQYDDETTSQMRRQFSEAEAKRCWNLLKPNGSSDSILTENQFVEVVEDTARSLDRKRILPLTVSMMLVGSSVGVVTPAMPFVVQNMGLTAGEYGLVVSAFALAKMTGNIPSAVLVERHGRKPYLVYTMAMIAVGVGGIGLASSFEELFLCRLFTGLGVAGLSTAATMTVTDISTPLNRASTFAPIMSAFAAGTALGPAIGGISCDYIGINPTFYAVGVSYIGLAAINHLLLKETKPTHMQFPWHGEIQPGEPEATIRESFESALGQWVPLLSQVPIRNVCIMNGFYWIALAGSQMTLLPLILTDPEGLAMTATNVGQVYMGMSVVQVLGNPILGKLVDRVGKVPGIVGGCTLIASAMATLPFCTDTYQLAGIFGVWATGSSLLSTAPLAFISDEVDDEKRAQAIALLRTSGDVGFLIGASSMGALADWTSSLDLAMQSSAGILLTATSWFAVRNMLNAQLANEKNHSS